MSSNPSQFQILPPANEELFENLCLDLYTAEFGDQTQKIGRRGQAQQGVDIFNLNQNIGIQCKKKDYANGKLKEEELKNEVDKAKQFEPPLKRFILATTCKRDAKIQEIARKISAEHTKKNLFSVEIHSWDEIKELFDKHPEVYERHYSFSISPNTIKSLQSTSRHQELNRIADLLQKNQPKTAFDMLEQFEQAKWDQLEDKEKYRLLTNKASALIAMKKEQQASALLIKALQFNKEDEDANTNCAIAHLIYGNLQKSKEFVKKAKSLNPLNVTAHVIEIQIKYKEGQTLEDITTSLPKSLKTKTQIAFILSYISLQKKQYASSQKWLDIYTTQKNNNNENINIESESGYADISLSLILAKSNVFTGRNIPENLQPELTKIIEIYQKLNSNKYSELRKYKPNWSLHYALALELNGELDKAILALKNGIEDFPQDDHLKVELSRLFVQNKEIPKAIDILEQLLGLNTKKRHSHNSPHSSSFPHSSGSRHSRESGNPEKQKPDFSNQNSSISSSINISEKSLNSALFLADLYFYNKQSEKAWKLLDQIRKIESLNKSDKLKIEQYYISKLIDFKKIDTAEKRLNPLFEKNPKDIITLILKSKMEHLYWSFLKNPDIYLDSRSQRIEDSQRLSENVTENSNQTGIKETKEIQQKQDGQNHQNKKIEYLKKAYELFKDKYKGQKSQPYFKNQEYLFEIEKLAQELYRSKMDIEVEDLLESITNKNLNHPEIFKLLEIYFFNGKNRQAIELAELLLKKFPNNIQVVSILFRIYNSLGNKHKAIQYYEDFLNSNPKNDFITIELAIAYIRNENILKATSLLKDISFNLKQLSTGQISNLSIAYIRIGEIKKSLETQYNCIIDNPRKLELQKTYFELFAFVNNLNLSNQTNDKQLKSIPDMGYKKIDISFLQPKKVNKDCYVRVQDIKTLEETHLTIEEKENENSYHPNDPFAKAFLGKKIEDIILFQDKKYKILDIKSKYVYKYQKILKDSEKRLAENTFVKSATIPKDANAKEILKTIKEELFPNISKQQEDFKLLFQFYSEGKATIGSIAKILAKHPIEIIGELIFSEQNKLITAIPEWENSEKTQALLDNKTDILFDLSSLITIHQLQMEKLMESSKFNLYICQSTIDSVKIFIQNRALHSKKGLLTLSFDKEGNPIRNFIPPKSIKRDLIFWEKVKDWAEQHCQLKTISTDIILNRKDRQLKEEVIGKEFFDSFLAVDKNIIFLCEDAILRKFSELERFTTGIRVFDLIKYFEKQIIIENKEAVKLKSQLVQLNQTYIPIDYKILFFLLKETEYNIRDKGFQRGLFFLSPVSNLSGVIIVVAQFIVEVCQDPALLPYKKQMILKEVLDKASFGRKEGPQEIAYSIFQLIQVGTKLLPLLQNEIRRYIEDWLSLKLRT